MSVNTADIIFSVLSKMSGHSPKEIVSRPNGGEIYRIWFDNDPTNKCYVGQTIQGALKRIRQHIEDAQSGDDGCPLLDAATRRFGIQHMRYEILEEGIETHEDLDMAEKYWISYFNSQEPGGYNVKRGGQRKSPISAAAPKKKISTLSSTNPLAASIAEQVLDSLDISPKLRSGLGRLIR